MAITRLIAENGDLLFQEDGGGYLITEDSVPSGGGGGSEGFETPDVDGRTVRGYRISLGAGEQSGLIFCRDAIAVEVLSDVAGVEMMLPEVPASGNPTNSGGAQLAGLIAASTSSEGLDPTATLAGYLPADLMPPFFYLDNTSGAAATVSIWMRRPSE